jgi:hypothetical protein
MCLLLFLYDNVSKCEFIILGTNFTEISKIIIWSSVIYLKILFKLSEYSFTLKLEGNLAPTRLVLPKCSHDYQVKGRVEIYQCLLLNLNHGVSIHPYECRELQWRHSLEQQTNMQIIVKFSMFYVYAHIEMKFRPTTFCKL